MIVETKYGKIRGFGNKSVSGRKYFSFLGIPYAKPPIDELRFLAPAPLENWDGIYDATYERDRCHQVNTLFDKEGVGSEDCLHLNIHTHEINPTSLKPVLFYIHGGGFYRGSGTVEMHGADYLVDYDVILVTINYRLHILGFLNLEIPECSGNVGLKDQITALKWIKENIKAFGGDPNNITIGGCSSGGSCVGLLMISPSAKGLFQKAIAQGGNSLSSWSITYDPIKWAFIAGKRLGFMGDDRLELLNFFKTVPVSRLSEVASELQDEVTKDYPARILYCPFSPSVEIAKEEACCLPDLPENLSQSATPVPLIIGYNECEFVCSGNYLPRMLRTAPASVLSEIIRSNFKVTPNQLFSIKNEIYKFYFEQNNGESALETIYKLFTDLVSLRFYDSFEFISQSNYVPSFVYYFTYYTENSIGRKISFDGMPPLIKKPFHGEEQNFILPIQYPGSLYTDGVDGEVRKNMCEHWTKFMKTGKPSSQNAGIQWRSSTVNEPFYLQIDNDLELKQGKINENRMNFLKELLKDVEMTC